MIRNRPMTRADLDTVLDWAAAEGWNPGTDDTDAFLAADPHGFFVAEANGAPVAAISVVNHSDTFAFLGLYLCLPSHRGPGIAHALWQHALAHAGTRTVGLDGVPAQQANYARSGFAHAGETVRYAGRVPGARDTGIRRATEADVATMIALETHASGWSKPAYLDAWVRQTPNRASFVSERDGNVAGMATVRRCREGAKIGPLVAADEEMALALIAHAAAEMGPDIIVDVPSTSAPLDDICRGLELSAGFNTARMYRGAARASGSNLYAVTTLELG